MPLEATLLLADNSDFSINSDYLPSRWQACTDALHLIFNAKCNANPESEVGMMTAAGDPDGSRRPEVLTSFTSDSIKLIAAVHGVQQSGELDLVTSIQVAQLALKHRSNKNQHQRIVAMVGSPLPANEAHSKEALSKLGKKLKKNNVALDVISYGEIEDNAEALQALVESANSSDTSHLLVVPPSTDVLLSEVIRSSAILAEEGQGFGSAAAGGSGEGGAGGAGAGGGDGFGVDPNLDPELAMALRMSLEDERARQAASAPAPEAGAAQADAQAGQEPPAPSAAMAASSSSQNASGGMDVDEGGSAAQQTTTPAAKQPEPAQGAPGAGAGASEEDPDLAMAMAMSRGEDIDMSGGAQSQQSTQGQQQQQQQGGGQQSEEEEDEEEIKRAIALSLQGDNNQDKK